MHKTNFGDTLALFWAQFCWVGRIPFAPGTWGSFAAILLAPLCFMPLPWWGRLLILGALFFSGTIACTRAARLLQAKDPGSLVIDEVLGQWLTCLPFSTLSLWEYTAAFALFRFFDIIKPPPVCQAERLPGGLGIMLDDAVAAIYAMVGLYLLRHYAL